MLEVFYGASDQLFILGMHRLVPVQLHISEKLYDQLDKISPYDITVALFPGFIFRIHLAEKHAYLCKIRSTKVKVRQRSSIVGEQGAEQEGRRDILEIQTGKK